MNPYFTLVSGIYPLITEKLSQEYDQSNTSCLHVWLKGRFTCTTDCKHDILYCLRITIAIGTKGTDADDELYSHFLYYPLLRKWCQY